MANNRIDIVKAEIICALAFMAPDRLSKTSALEEEQDLLEFIDSFGFVQLLMSVEEPLGVELDLTTVDLGAIVRFGDLAAFIAKAPVRKAASELAGAE
jgi:acyl carrier protein